MGDEDKTERIEVGECLPEKPSGQENESKLFPQIQAIFIGKYFLYNAQSMREISY